MADDRALRMIVIQEAILSQLLRIDRVGCFFHECRKERPQGKEYWTVPETDAIIEIKSLTVSGFEVTLKVFPEF